jgi:hypothetical protein
MKPMNDRVLLETFLARREAQQIALDMCLLLYETDLVLAEQGSGCSDPLQDLWDTARRYALQDVAEGRCGPSPIPRRVPVFVTTRDVLSNRARQVNKALERKRQSSARPLMCDGPPPRIADLVAEAGCLVTDPIEATFGPVYTLSHAERGPLRAIDVTPERLRATILGKA